MICKTSPMILMCGLTFLMCCDQIDSAADRAADSTADRAADYAADCAADRAADCAADHTSNLSAAQEMSLSRPPRPVTQNMAPRCNICSYKQPEPDRP